MDVGIVEKIEKLFEKFGENPIEVAKKIKLFGIMVSIFRLMPDLIFIRKENNYWNVILIETDLRYAPFRVNGICVHFIKKENNQIDYNLKYHVWKIDEKVWLEQKNYDTKALSEKVLMKIDLAYKQNFKSR